MVKMPSFSLNVCCRSHFLGNSWLGVDVGDGTVERCLPVASEDELKRFQYLFFATARKDLTDGHLWVSVFSRPTRSTFTRVQRVSCCVSLLFTTMIANAMFYRSTDNMTIQNNDIAGLSFSMQQVYISIASSLIVIPVNLLIVTLFRKARPCKSKQKKLITDHRAAALGNTINRWGAWGYYDGEKMSYDYDVTAPYRNVIGNFDKARPHTADYHPDPRKKRVKKKKPGLPHAVVYFAWILVFLTIIVSGFFTILYSMEWGKEKAEKWLMAFSLSFFESVFVIQPLKVRLYAHTLGDAYSWGFFLSQMLFHVYF